ncbi:hypothetical protein F8154_04140 [Alkaliphilus pronyensis]|uniref:Type I restriction modification DNA specificity domain-containing protein n=1 Tax=Alkaliphilus pronyensis TaxID=1482732 RepID=A0A6I0FED8_9FIRM|nr:restriction endonuclease subunit S [Alkaliphilus pronyensis]KAB3536275.1 hypothetical protein F8154_04140 [Alkaliphilus pronyensis]
MKNLDIWSEGTLGAFCDIRIGGTPSRNNEDYWDTEKETENLWVSIKDLNASHITETSEYISDAGVKNSNVKKIHKGEILLSFKLTIGKVAFAGRPLYTNEAIAALSTEKLDNKFLFYGLQKWNLLQDVDQAIKGATLNKEKLKRIKFLYPESKLVQSKIAEVIETVDSAIEKFEDLIAKQKRIKTGLMQDLLTKGIDENGDIRSEESHQFKDTQLGRVPIEWEVKPLRCYAAIYGGYAFSSKDYVEEGIQLIRIGNLFKNALSLNRDPVFLDESFRNDYSRFLLRKGDIILSMTGTVGKRDYGFAVKIDTEDEFLLNQRVCKFVTNNITPEFLLIILHSEDYLKRLYDSAGGTKQANLNESNILDIPIKMPSAPEQERITRIFNKCEQTITDNTLHLNKLKSIKVALMQDLLSGKKSVTSLLNDLEVVS